MRSIQRWWKNERYDEACKNNDFTDTIERLFPKVFTHNDIWSDDFSEIQTFKMPTSFAESALKHLCIKFKSLKETLRINYMINIEKLVPHTYFQSFRVLLMMSAAIDGKFVFYKYEICESWESLKSEITFG